MPTLQKKIVKGHTYWYIVTSKRINGKPTPIILKYLGTIENILKNSTISEEGSVKYKSYSHGAVYALWKIAEKYNVLNIMRKYFKDNSRSGNDVSTSILLGAIHRACEGGSKRSFSEFAGGTTLPEIADFKAEKVTSQQFWEQMDKVDLKEIELFQKKFTKELHRNKVISFEKLSFDTTNFFTYIDSGNNRSKLARRGHNKQKRNDLKQFSLELLVSKNFLIPLSSYIYEGNITDQSILSPYIKSFRNNINTITESDKVTVIFDKGGCSKGNLKDIEEEGFHYICAFSLNHKKDLIEIPLSDYETKKVKDKDILLLKKEENIWDKQRTVLLYYSSKLHEGQIRGLNKSIEDKEEKLLSLQETLKNPRTGIKTRAQLENKLSQIINGEKKDKEINIIEKNNEVCKNINKNIEILNKFALFAKQKKSEIYLSFPCYKASLYYAKNMRFLYIYLKKTSNLEIIGKPDNYIYPDSYFFDTNYHLNYEGRRERTIELIKYLKPYLSSKDNN